MATEPDEDTVTAPLRERAARAAASYTNPQTGRGVATGGNIALPEASAGSGLDLPRCVVDHDHGADEGHCVYETDAQYAARLAPR